MGCYRYYAHAEMVLPLQPIGGFQRFRNRFYKKANPTTYRLAFYKGHKSSTLKGSLQFGRVLIDTFLLINLFFYTHSSMTPLFGLASDTHLQ